ncbi:MAG: adenosine kinase [Proteobacteria bacterium]|nr:adenosine kinase [Pseudomonadota bacterium]
MNHLFNGRKVIVGIGSALVDILAHEEEEFLVRTGAAKGGMQLVDHHHELEALLSGVSGTPSIVCGGSACNTVMGVGRLGGRGRFVGKCGTDDFGRRFREGLDACNIEANLIHCDVNPTGRVLSIVTPDAQRSMFTFLGASALALPEEIARSTAFDQAAVVHVEGYLLFNPDLIRMALSRARDAGAAISLDLAAYTVVDQSRDFLFELVEEYVDILIANEDEARAYTGETDEATALAILAEHTEVAVLKVGERGSHIAAKGRTVRVRAMGNGPALDTTGAGDLWASGFLYGLVHGMSLEKAGELGSACGYEVCQVLGAQIPEEGWERIRKLLD